MESSAFAKFRPGESRFLNIVFSQAAVAPGKFAIERVLTSNKNPVLFVNSPNNDFYQHGIPAFGTTIEESAARIRQLITEIGATKVRCLGMSMGASAAIIFGALIEADQVVAIAPEMEMGLPQTRSIYQNRDRRFHPAHSVLVNHLNTLDARAHLTFPAYDFCDWHHAAIVRRMGRNFILMRQFHSGGQSIDWGRLIDASVEEFNLQNFITCGIEPPIDTEELQTGAKAYTYFCQRDFDSAIRLAAPLFERHPLVGTALFLAAAFYEKNDILNGDIWIERLLTVDVEKIMTPARVDYDYVSWISNSNRALIKERVSLLRAISVAAR